MNRQESDILNALYMEPYINQRILSDLSGHSLGVVNRSIKTLIRDGYLNEEITLTHKAISEFKMKAPKNAVILAAGCGMRMVPINMEVPKGLIEINGEPLIERIIKQLHEVGIQEIYIIIGFMKEQFEYLIDEYNVKLIVNANYAVKNNLHSIKLVLEHLSNTYVIPCDIWCDKNPFSKYELYSWYMVGDLIDNDSSVKVNRKMELVSVPDAAAGNIMIGISYLLEEQAAVVRERILEFSNDAYYDDAFWEEALYYKDKMILTAKVVHFTDVVEINTYEQLRDLDSGSNQLKSDVIAVIAEALKTEVDEIKEITMLKKGMTNRSFIFTCKGKKYIARIPGEGTERLINRKEEAEVYKVISGKNICDDAVYINSDNGYKITRYLENVRCCDPFNSDDLKKCMAKLREFHEMELSVGHEFDIFRQIEFYESLWGKQPSAYKDYYETKRNVFSLKSYIERHVERKVLTHMDAVPDNFLFTGNEKGAEEIQLIDWEYAGMQDPHVDIAMFCIYSLYNKQQIDELISIYFTEGCSDFIRLKIYGYISACGLLWSNWCEYKRNLGVEFGEYSLCQYRYAKDYYRIVSRELSEIEVNR